MQKNVPALAAPVAVCLVLLGIAGPDAQAAERVVAVRPASLARDVAAYPQILSPVDDAETAINQALKKLDATVVKARAECLRQNPKSSDWTRNIDVPMRGPRYLSYVVTDNAFCGGAHPNVGDMAIVYDLRTGKPIDMSQILPAKLLGKLALAGGMDGTRTIQLTSEPLMKLYQQLYRQPRQEDDKECADAISMSGDEIPPFVAWLDAGTGGVGLLPDLPHVIQACADPVVIPVATLRAQGAPAEALAAIQAAHEAWKDKPVK